MKIKRYPIIFAVLWVLAEIFDIFLMIFSFIKIDFSDKASLNINNPYVFKVIFFVVMFFAVLQFFTLIGHYEVTEKDIKFKCPFYSKIYKWNEFKYIAKLKYHRNHMKDDEIFIFSIELEKENINDINSVIDNNKMFFRLPYSKELETMISSSCDNYIEHIENEITKMITL